MVLSCTLAHPLAMIGMTHQFQDGYFHLTLVQVRRFVLDHLDRKELMRPHILTFDNLSKSTLTKDIQDQIPSNQLLPMLTLCSSPITTLFAT